MLKLVKEKNHFRLRNLAGTRNMCFPPAPEEVGTVGAELPVIEYEKMKFDGEEGKKETGEASVGVGDAYNEITFHQPGEASSVPGESKDAVEAVPGVDNAYNEITFHEPSVASAVPGPNATKLARDPLTFSGSYELPSPMGAHSAPAPSTGYMALNVPKEEKSEYHSPDVGNSRARKMFGSITRRLGRSEEGVDSAVPSSGSCKMNWSLMLVVVSLVVALVAILFSVVALGLSTTKCGSCSSLREDANAVKAKLGTTATVKCTYDMVTSCNFTSGPFSDSQAFCETSPSPYSTSAPILRCVVTTTLVGQEDKFVATVLNRPGGYSCQCYQTSSSNAKASTVLVRCSMVEIKCFL